VSGGRRAAVLVRPRAVAMQGPFSALHIDKLGVVIAVLSAAALFVPFAILRPNRIAGGEAKAVIDALPLYGAFAVAAAYVVPAAAALFARNAWFRLAAAVAGLVVLTVGVGQAAVYLTPAGNRFARIAPAAGYWTGLFSLTILFADACVRLKLGAVGRLAALALALAAVAVLLASGAWDRLSILLEYANRADTFWREAGSHVWLATGSLAAAFAAGLPLGIAIDRVPRLRAPVLNVLNITQTIPSIALFGILIAPLGWIAAHVPGASGLGIRGIGAAPAFVALFIYSLLPMVANTAVGLVRVPRDAVEAARGMGMTGLQSLTRIELPLAMPLILTGVRIVLVQNIGLATIAALIGGGGFGVFVFQGIGQTATDLILLGAVPTVVLAFAAAIVLDAVIELSAGTRP
jgi:osmoprotectant transport system permease protein